MLSMVTVASSTRMPTASARPPSVMMLRVSPIAESTAIAPSTDSGMEMAMIRVDRQLPRNTSTSLSNCRLVRSNATRNTASGGNSESQADSVAAGINEIARHSKPAPPSPARASAPA